MRCKQRAPPANEETTSAVLFNRARCRWALSSALCPAPPLELPREDGAAVLGEALLHLNKEGAMTAVAAGVTLGRRLHGEHSRRQHSGALTSS